MKCTKIYNARAQPLLCSLNLKLRCRRCCGLLKVPDNTDPYIYDYTLFFDKNIVFPAETKYSYFSADFRLKVSLWIFHSELLSAEGVRAEPYTLENLRNHRSKKFWLSRDCTSVRPFVRS